VVGAFTGLWATVLVVACSGGDRARPQTEFLVAAGDSTFWVQSSDTAVRVRSAPLLLTRVGDSFYELFIADDVVDYEDASFAAARIFAREITSADSVALVDDGRVGAQRDAWRAAHPDALALLPDDEAMDVDPATIVSEELEILDVHGPWVSFNHLYDMDLEVGAPHVHVGRRGVVDVRTGRTASLADLFGGDEATRLERAGRARLSTLTDSIRRADDDRAAEARQTLNSFEFTVTSFGITDSAGVPAVAFMVPGTGVNGEALALNLPPIAVAPPAWWRDVTPTLPIWSADSTEARWPRTARATPFEIVARPVNEGEQLALLVRRDAATWPMRTIPSPAYQLMALDEPPLSATLRTALARAFDASATLDGVIKSAQLSHERSCPTAISTVHHVPLPTPRTSRANSSCHTTPIFSGTHSAARSWRWSTKRRRSSRSGTRVRTASPLPSTASTSANRFTWANWSPAKRR
jgi:hypothetical protein